MDPGLVVPFGRYVLKERLAQGGMGEVFRAVAVGEHGFEKPVVVKRILPAHAGREDLTDLFVAEAKLMTRLAHPNIVEVLDFGRGEHRDYYLVLELVEGADLGRLIRAVGARGEPFPIPLALFIASQVLRGLHHAHTKLARQQDAGEGGVVVHRDVSPSNVLCSTEGEVKVADFGVALVTRGGEAGGQAGVAGKPGYMAPEQFDGGTLDPRADVFSAAVVLQQMLTAEMPFAGDTVEAQQETARRGERRAARDLRPEVSEAVEAILAKAMAPRPDDRFPDARTMAQAIEALRDQGQRIASGDDLAEAVHAAQRELPAAGRRVIALTGSSAAAPASEDAPRELTRTGGKDGAFAFTLRFPVRADATTAQREGDPGAAPADRWSAAEPRTERIAPDERPSASDAPEAPAAGPAAADGSPSGGPVEGGQDEPSFPSEPHGSTMGVRPPEPGSTPEPGAPPDEPRPRAIRWAALTAALGVALFVVVTFAVRPSRPAAQEPPATPPSPPATPALALEPSAVEPAAPVQPATTTLPAPRFSGRLPAVRSAVPTAGPATSSAPAPVAVAIAPAASSTAAAPAAGCAGDVDFFSETSWTITGGPGTVASPNRNVVWPCGTYALVATSRVDPTQVKQRTITVGPLRRTVVDLR